MKKFLTVVLCMALLLAACGKANDSPPAQQDPPAAETPAETPEETPVEELDPELVLREGDVEITQGSVFDALTLIESGNYDEIEFSSIDTSVAGEQELVITISKNGKTEQYTKTIHVVRPKTNVTWEMKTEGPVFLIHPDNLTGAPEEDEYKSFYEFPVFTSDPPEVAEQMNEVISEIHMWGISEQFKMMSNSISPEHGNADILQARTVVSEGKEAVVVHTTYIVALYQSPNIGETHIVTIFDTATGLLISNQELLERYDLSSDILIERLNAFVSEQEFNTQKLGDIGAYEPGMTQEELSEYLQALVDRTASDDYYTVFLEENIDEVDLQGKLTFVEDGKLFSEFIVFRNAEKSEILPVLYEVGPVE